MSKWSTFFKFIPIILHLIVNFLRQVCSFIIYNLYTKENHLYKKIVKRFKKIFSQLGKWKKDQWMKEELFNLTHWIPELKWNEIWWVAVDGFTRRPTKEKSTIKKEISPILLTHCVLNGLIWISWHRSIISELPIQWYLLIFITSDFSPKRLVKQRYNTVWNPGAIFCLNWTAENNICVTLWHQLTWIKIFVYLSRNSSGLISYYFEPNVLF